MTEVEQLRLTELAAMGGCAAKTSADALARITASLRGPDSAAPAGIPGLLVGLAEPDDAAVFTTTAGQAMVTTVDFFAPIVDDPYSYGAIAATNAMSDVYAMGGDVLLALNVAAMPVDLDEAIIADIFRGGQEKVTQAGGVIVGGHTVMDREPKYGLCVIGTIDPARVLRKGGARPGDQLYLTKPLGTGIISTAGKSLEAEAAHLDACIASMTTLNRDASRIARTQATAMTDVTGFSLLGHASEMTNAGDVQFVIDSANVPLLDGALEYVQRGILNGGIGRNQAHLEGSVTVEEGVPADVQPLLFDPQTSGGLLFSVPPAASDEVEGQFAAAGLRLWRIGEVHEGRGVIVR